MACSVCKKDGHNKAKCPLAKRRATIAAKKACPRAKRGATATGHDEEE